MFTLRHRGPSLGALSVSFELALRAANRSEPTVTHYRTLIGHLVDRVGDIPARSIRPETLRRALLSVKGTPHRRTGGPVSDRYVDHHRKAWRALFAWAEDQAILPRSPAAGLEPFRIDEREPRTLTLAQAGAILCACPPTFEGERDRAMISFLLGTGVRRRELVTISLDDVALDEGLVRIRGKTRRWRRVPLGPRLGEVLGRYIAAVRPRVLFGDSGRLFTDRIARALAPNAINLMLIRRARAGGLRRASPHMLRHTFATEYLRAGGERAALKRILGHSTDGMLDRYVHLVDVDIVRDHRRASPFERLALAG